MQTSSSDTLAPLAVAEALPVALPRNIVRIESQAELYGYGVALFGYLEVADEEDAAEKAEGRPAFLLKSKIRPVYYLILPSVTVTKEWTK